MTQQKEPDKQVGTKLLQHITDELVKPEQVGKQPEELEEEELDEEVVLLLVPPPEEDELLDELEDTMHEGVNSII